MGNKTKNILIGVLLIMVVILTVSTCTNKETETIEVPVQIEVPVPVIEKEYDTIYLPQPVKVIKDTIVNNDLKIALDNANTELDSLRALKDFVVVRDYKEVFDDSIQTITATASTTGTLDKLNVKYKTKPRTIEVDTIIETEVKYKYKNRFGIGMEVGIPIDKANELYLNPTTNQLIQTESDLIYKANLEFDTRKFKVNLGLDTEKTGWFGLTYKF